jgi:hypothetical protein
MRPLAGAVCLGLAAVVLAGAGAAGAQTAQPLEGAWHLTGRIVATGCAGRCVTQRQAVDEEIVITASGVTGAEGLAPGCGGGVSQEEFEGLATLVPGRRGWLKIRIVDRPRFLDLMRRCIGYRSLRLGRIRGRVRIAPDGRSFDEVVSVPGSVTVAGRRATFLAKGRVHAEWVGETVAARAGVGPAALARAVGATLATDDPAPFLP